MSTQHRSETVEPVQFVVRPDGTVRGDDGASGALVMALPYTGRLGRRIGEFVDAGDLRAMECFGRDRLTVGVTWTPGEGTFRGVVTPLPTEDAADLHRGRCGRHRNRRQALPQPPLRCRRRRVGLGGRADSRVIDAISGPRELHHLAEVGTRMIAILRSLEDEHVNGFVRLRFEHGDVIGASLGHHILMAFASAATDDDLIAVIDEIRAILADRHDLAAVTTEFDPGSSSRPGRTPTKPKRSARPSTARAAGGRPLPRGDGPARPCSAPAPVRTLDRTRPQPFHEFVDDLVDRVLDVDDYPALVGDPGARGWRAGSPGGRLGMKC